MKKLTVLKLFLFFVMFSISGMTFFGADEAEITGNVVRYTETGIVSYVISGNTIELSDGRRVRLLGINAPEVGEKCYYDAKTILQTFVEGKHIMMESDVDDTDLYNSLLRYIYVERNGRTFFVNKAMISGGYANSYIIEPNERYLSEFNYARYLAQQAATGCIWQK